MPATHDDNPARYGYEMPIGFFRLHAHTGTAMERLQGFEENADLVGAINILAAGHAVSACGDTSPAIGASAQEPTEAVYARCA